MPNRRTLFKHLLAVTACVGALGLAGAAAAQGANAKIAADLASFAGASAPPQVTWAKTLGGQTYAKVLIVASGSDARLTSLREAVLAQGGSVYSVFASVRAMAALVPVSALPALAARGDVLAIAPNRSTARTRSLVAESTGAAAVPGFGTASAFDGRGVGIAVLDSGIDWDHRNMLDAAGKTRVAQVVDVVALNKQIVGTGWTRGKDYSEQVRWQFGYDNAKASDAVARAPKSKLPDPNGHGTVVASIAAGRGGYQTPDVSGVAPGATLYDVRVLDERGVGTVADLLVGIDWVLQRSRLHNIRVMNLSLAANGTDSFVVDPLARAARSAVAAGIVVVASASNAGKNEAGQEVYGAISSPGIEPSVITVGA
ncbi:MAG TPA: S8 family serine peptidase, partial [Rubrivivax sp.]|nr:S8 family serine peptidase [Rubrivivax sp.]